MEDIEVLCVDERVRREEEVGKEDNEEEECKDVEKY